MLRPGNMEFSFTMENTAIQKRQDPGGSAAPGDYHVNKPRLDSFDHDRGDDSSSTPHPGLDWDWVATLDQDPEGKDYFPPYLDPFDACYFRGDEIDKPYVATASDLPQYTAWALTIIRQSSLGGRIEKMKNDKNLGVKWVICPRKDPAGNFRDLDLSFGPVNHEAVFAAMVGTVLPPERACAACKDNRGVFQQCIVLPGYLNGACAGCYHDSGGSVCSHRPDPRQPRTSISLPPTIPAALSPMIEHLWSKCREQNITTEEEVRNLVMATMGKELWGTLVATDK
ncbi:hypothetical protein GGR53DRAFT_473745 [Hypoxylon sp. FL1150]|nr:hypothetical protein GGR53DRAFT_473745 [Hypoxylon sp. FL1150]